MPFLSFPMSPPLFLFPLSSSPLPLPSFHAHALQSARRGERSLWASTRMSLVGLEATRQKEKTKNKELEKRARWGPYSQ